jgi:hypothetical protein
MPCPDIDTLATLGGALQNYSPVEDPTTDLDAATYNITRLDVASMTQTSNRAWVNFTANTTTGTMTLVAHAAHWGSSIAVAPTLARVTTGTFTVTWPATVTDDLGNVHTLNMRFAKGNARGGGTYYDVQAQPSGLNSVTVYVYNSANALTDAAGVAIDIWWG